MITLNIFNSKIDIYYLKKSYYNISMNDISMNNSSTINNSYMINNSSMINNLSKINTTNCICFKNKTSTVQCNRKRVKGTEYCGIHLRAKTKNRFDTF